jgi:hypothetical protein
MEHAAAPRELRYVVALLLVIALLVGMAATVPLAIMSFLDELGDPGDSVYSSIGQDAALPGHRVTLDITEMDEVAGTMTTLATAARGCQPTCSTADEMIVRSVNVDADDSVVPVEERLTFEAPASSTSREIVLPLYGNYLHYPFDRWALVLKVDHAPAAEGGAAASEDDVAPIALSVTSRLPRMEMHPRAHDADDAGSGGGVAVVLQFERPTYLPLVTIWMILSVAAIAACVVILSSTEALVASSAGLVLAVWGIRGILLGSLVPATSAVDIALSVVVVFILVATLVRIVWLFENRGRMRVLSRLPGVAPSAPAPPVSPSAARPPDFRPGNTGTPARTGGDVRLDGQT